jgi:hypothetical protein
MTVDSMTDDSMTDDSMTVRGNEKHLLLGYENRFGANGCVVNGGLIVAFVWVVDRCAPGSLRPGPHSRWMRRSV